MAEEAQELEVTNTGQPLTVDIAPAVTPVEVAQELEVTMDSSIEVDIDPAAD